jgi:phosphate transport system protein
MNASEKDLEELKESLTEMWDKTISQINYAGEALLNNNKELAQKVILRESTLDAMEVLIDERCEEYIALYSPVAVDLRFILSTLRINNNLERIGDFAFGIARFSLKVNNLNLEADLIQELRLNEMLIALQEMMQIAKIAFFGEDVELAKDVIKKDKYLDQIKTASQDIVEQYIKLNSDRIYECLRLQGVIRKLERAGDHCVNIAEEIIFYIDAKIVKHSKTS